MKEGDNFVYCVAVIMSTYNGAMYLEEQIDSILSQEDVSVNLYIRDDGSEEETIRLLHKYEHKDNIDVFYEKNVGVCNSFMKTMYKIDNVYDYYSFADQDDIWDKRKIINAIKQFEDSGGVLYASNQECINKEGFSLGMRYGRQHINLNSIEILSRNMLSGCTMVFSRKLFGELIKIEHRPSAELLNNRIHDVWVAMIASLYGEIYYDTNSYIRYRQHENNVVGAYTEGVIYDIKQKISKLLDSKQRNGRSKLAFEIVNKFPEKFQKDDFMWACAYPHKLRNRFLLLKNARLIKRGSGETLLGLYFKILVDLF